MLKLWLTSADKLELFLVISLFYIGMITSIYFVWNIVVVYLTGWPQISVLGAICIAIIITIIRWLGKD